MMNAIIYAITCVASIEYAAPEIPIIGIKIKQKATFNIPVRKVIIGMIPVFLL
jgi:hypothetical protein